MNWIGGARSRLNRRNEKRKQEQFFEDKRKAKQLNNTTVTSHLQSSSLHLSQDILSIKTLSNAYSEKSVESCKPPKHARFVDLDHGKSNSRFVSLKSHDDSFEKNIKPSKLPLGGYDETLSKSCFPKEKVDFSICQGVNKMVDFLDESVIEESKAYEKCLSSSEESLVEEAENIVLKDTVKLQQKEIKKVNKESNLPTMTKSQANEKMKEIKSSNAFFNLFNC